jgi:sigma-B regulation protein RsbU (phosphoserine phosphatase)
MNARLKAPLMEQLVDRRRRVTEAIRETAEADDLVRLLGEIDAALTRLDGGMFGRCEVCHQEVDDDFLLANPLIEYCLCNFTPDQLGHLQEDIGLAGRIQWALLPKQDLRHAGYETHFRYEPAGPVSGDYCDLLTHRGQESVKDEESLLFIVGDVSGKGFAASLLMAQMNAAFRSLAGTGLRVDQLVESANRLLLESKIPSHYVTLVCGKAERSGEVILTNAGHCPPLVLREREVGTIDATGFPVGMFGESFTTTRIRLAPGESLFVYTDGLTEARLPDGEEYGTERLVRLLREHRNDPPRGLASRAIEDMDSFLGGVPRHDDLTILVVRREPA